MVRKFHIPYSQFYGIRLVRRGCASRPFYLIGAQHKRVRTSKVPELRPDEVIGSFDPMPNERGELLVACDLNRFNYYIGKGARVSKLLAQVLGLAGYYPMHPKVYINAWRAREGLETKRGLRPDVHPKLESRQQ